MSAVGSSTSAGSAAAAPLSAAAPTAATGNAPGGLVELAAGAILNGAVIGRDSQGHTLVRTANGVLALSTALTLPPGSQLSLQIQSIGAQIQMVVLSINQQPAPQGASAQAVVALPAPGTALRPQPAAGEPAPAVTVAAATVLRATVIEAADASLATAMGRLPRPGQHSKPASNTLPGRQPTLGSASPPGPAAAPDPAGARELPFLPGPRAIPGPEAGGASAPASFTGEGDLILPSAGARLAVRILAIEADGAREPLAILRAAAKPESAPAMLGRVTGQDRSGQLHVRTALGLLALSAKAPLPPGTYVVLELLGEAEAAAPIPTVSPPPGPVQAGDRWPALDEAIAALTGAERVASPGIPHFLPQAGPALAAQILVVLYALRSGILRDWLGESPIRALEGLGRHDLVQRLGAELPQMARVIADQGGGEWRSFAIPLWDGAATQLVHFDVKRQPRRAQGPGESEGATRFLVEAELSRLGPLQLDGLVNPARFDLVVRTTKPLPAEMRQDISGIFSQALADAHYTGGLTFQTAASLPASPRRAAGAMPVVFSV